MRTYFELVRYATASLRKLDHSDRALDLTLERLRSKFGDDPSTWPYPMKRGFIFQQASWALRDFKRGENAKHRAVTAFYDGASVPDPSSGIDERQLLGEVQRCLETLSERDRSIFLDIKLEGYGCIDRVAKEYRLSIQRVKQILHDVTAKLNPLKEKYAAQ
jgi:DNA-directed RNA polymerase specialized sigma24 family protein